MLTFVISCQKKAVPTVQSRSIDPAPPITATVNVTPDTLAGRSLYANHCNRCHGLPEIANYSTKRWDIILSSMIPRTRLSKEQEVHVTAYIKVNCPK